MTRVEGRFSAHRISKYSITETKRYWLTGAAKSANNK
jgi:hypothetical protein